MKEDENTTRIETVHRVVFMRVFIFDSRLIHVSCR